MQLDQLDQKKKILLMVGILGLLIVGVLFAIFGLKGSGGNTGDTGTAATSTPAPPPMPDATTATSPSPTAPPPSAAPVPTPNAAPSGTPVMSGAQAGGMSPIGAAPANAVGKFVDPFKGGLPRIMPPKPPHRPKPYVDTRPIVPIIPIPAVSNQPQTPAKSNNDGFDFTQSPATNNETKTASVGRNAGWIAVDGKNNVTAYFENKDGSYQTVYVGSYVNGWRVKSIDRDYMIVVDDATGKEDRIKLLGNAVQMPSSSIGSPNNSNSALPNWKSR